MKNILLAFIFAFTSTGWATCPDDYMVMAKGDVAQCDGVLFSPDATKRADEAQQDIKYYRLMNDRLELRSQFQEKEIAILDKRLALYVQQSDVLAKEVVRKEGEDKWQKIIYFGLGVLATGIAVYGAAQLR